MKRLFFALTFIIFMFQFYLNASALTIEYDGTRTNYTGSIYELHVNGKKLTLPLDPIIFNDRALVPVREVFEELGATVTYQEKTKCVDVAYNGNNISLYINNPAAYINGKKAIIPDNAVPKLINKVGEPAKTMVPVRFISENLKMNVLFSDPVISISTEKTSSTTPTAAPTQKPTQTPKPTAKPTATPAPDTAVTSKITKLTFSDSGSGILTAKATLSGTPGKLDGFILQNPTRLVVDIYKCNYTVNSAYAVDINGISKIRVGYENGRARLVFDAENISSTVITLNNNVLTVKVGTTGAANSTVNIVNTNTNTSTPSPKPSATPSTTQSPVNITDIPYAEYKNSEKLIVIDAGHGGKDGGASGVLDGKTVLEKTLTLQMATRTKAVLESRGYTVKLTRETDVYPTLQARADFANNSNAAVFVSIHINSVESNPEASGTEVFYASLNNDTSYGLKSSYLAKYIQDYMIGNLGSKDRGVKQSEHLVTRSSIMPAVLVEVGFISNESELANMASASYQQKVAEAIAAGIIKGIDKISIPDNRDELLAERKTALEEWEKTQ
ncbi:MAG: N-acetylmuramoyl-L-alanine amidase [Clostridia bacterium]|nr:N-acetylmuramoyl-L-alanine amidase [Clostridia bacterium]